MINIRNDRAILNSPLLEMFELKYIISQGSEIMNLSISNYLALGTKFPSIQLQKPTIND